MAGQPVPGLIPAALLPWFAGHARELPWRTDPSPYNVLLSEFMCQQTQIATALPYFHAFKERWPRLEDLAYADEDEVTEAWAGLGYYSRARRLHACARAAVERGGLPSTARHLLELPGIGPYTAGAIASIAWGEAVPAIDGNVQRVISRWIALEARVDQRQGREAIEKVVSEAHQRNEGHPGDLNQALMELGAMVCKPRSPSCSSCPLEGSCAGRATPDAFPVKKRRTPPVRVEGVAVVVRNGDRVRLVKPPKGELLGGLWNAPFSLDRDELRALLPAGATPPLVLGEVRHVFSHRDLRAEVVQVQAPLDEDGRWVPLDDPGPGLSALALKVLELARHARQLPLLAADREW